MVVHGFGGLNSWLVDSKRNGVMESHDRHMLLNRWQSRSRINGKKQRQEHTLRGHALRGVSHSPDSIS